jgi:hypothetical protein
VVVVEVVEDWVVAAAVDAEVEEDTRILQLLEARALRAGMVLRGL